MNDNYQVKYHLPDHWTAEQAEFLSNFLQDLHEALCATYYHALRRLWQRRRFLFDSDNTHQHPESYGIDQGLDLDDDIPF